MSITLQRPVDQTIREFLTSSNPEHMFHQILSSYHFCDGMLHLKTCVHLQEIEVLMLITQELHSTSRAIIHSLSHHTSLFTHCSTCLLIQQNRRRFFHHLLITTLDRTFTFRECTVVAILISQYLNLDVTRFFNVLLNEHTIITKGRLSLLL